MVYARVMCYEMMVKDAAQETLVNGRNYTYSSYSWAVSSLKSYVKRRGQQVLVVTHNNAWAE